MQIGMKRAGNAARGDCSAKKAPRQRERTLAEQRHLDEGASS